jgi:hypothetical protein
MAVRVVVQKNKADEDAARLVSCMFPSVPPDVVDGIRKEAAARRDLMIAYQKEFSTDREAARFFKMEATDALKEYRAACLMLGHLQCEPPGDSKYVAMKDWPVELAPWINRVARRAECEHG